MRSPARLLVGILASLAFANTAFAQQTWRHGTVTPRSDAGFQFMAAENGFDKQFGIKIEMSALKGDVILTKALLSGDLDSYESNPGGALIAASKGADIRILGCAWPTLPYALYTKNVKSVADLKGKTVAVSDPGSLPDLFARAVLKGAGLDPDKDVSYVRAGSDADRIKALVAGVVDVTGSSIEFAARAPQLGLRTLAKGQEVTPEYPSFCFITTKQVLETKRKQAVAFIAAEMTALSYAVAHENETRALSAKITNRSIDDPDIKLYFSETRKDGLVAPSVPLSPKQIFFMRDLLADNGLLPRSFDPIPYIDPSIREDALKLVNK